MKNPLQSGYNDGGDYVLKTNLRKIRKESALTQKDLADKMNYSQQAVAKWEMGNSSPDVNNLARLSDELGVSIDSLVKDTPNCLKDKTVSSLETALYHALSSTSTDVELGLNVKELDDQDKVLIVDEIVMMLKSNDKVRDVLDRINDTETD